MPDNTMVDLMTQFRMTVYESFPYLSSYVYSLTPVERPGLGTMAVDKYGRMYYDPDWCETLTLEQGGYVVLHESVHLILRHCHRAPKIIGDHPTSQESLDLNIAMDIVVWEFMEAIKDKAPEGGVTFDKAKEKWPAIERNMTVEQLYHIINESRKKPPETEVGQPGKKDPEESDNDAGSDEKQEDGDGGSEQESPEDGPKDEGKSRGPSEQDQPEDSGSGGDEVEDDGFKPIGGGSAADGIPRDYEEEPDHTFEAFKEDRLLEAVEQNIEELENDRQWQAHSHPGTIPAELKRIIKSKLHPQPNPWDRLRATVARVGANHRGAPDYTYRRMNRRQDAIPDLLRLKGVRQYMPKAVVGVDSSGSMTPGCLRKAIWVIRDGLKALGEIPVVSCDAAVGQDIKVTRIGEDFDFRGGGGTDLRVLLDYADSEHRPDVVVLVTDGGTPWPDKPTRYQLVIALTQECSTPSWATTVRIPDQPTKETLDG